VTDYADSALFVIQSATTHFNIFPKNDLLPPKMILGFVQIERWTSPFWIFRERSGFLSV
jgi:hypothetical protein